MWRSIQSWKVNRRRNRSILRGGSPGSNPTPKNGARANGALKWLSGYRPWGLSEDCRTTTSGPDQYRHRAEPGRWESKLDSRNKHSNLARRQSYSYSALRWRPYETGHRTLLFVLSAAVVAVRTRPEYTSTRTWRCGGGHTNQVTALSHPSLNRNWTIVAMCLPTLRRDCVFVKRSW